MSAGPTRYKIYRMPPPDIIQQRITAIVSKLFTGKAPVTGRRPVAYITTGVQGAGKSTAIRTQVPKGFVVIDPDTVTNVLLGNGPLPDEGPVFSLASEWTHEIIKYLVHRRYDFVYDTALPGKGTLALIKAGGYFLKMILVRTPRPEAREREEQRDMRRGWGRPGIGLKSHRSTRDAIAIKGPELVRKFVDELTVCDNAGRVMHCEKCPLSASRTREMFLM